MDTFVLNTVELSFKEFLEKILQESGLTKDEFYKHKIVLIIPDLETYNLVKNSPLIHYLNPMEIKTNEDLQKSKAMLPLLNPNLFYITRKNSDMTYILIKRTEQELNEQIYKETLEKIDENLVNIDAELNEFYSKTEITQYYFNNHNNPVELILKLPYNPSIQFSKFTLDINGKKVISKVLDKEKAKEKYNDSIASGKTGAISSKEDNYIVVSIGNIETKSLVKLTTEFIQFLISEDMSFCYSTITDFPIIDIKNNNENSNEKFRNIKVKINIKTHSKILRLITEGLTKNISQKFNEDYTQCLIEYSLSEKDRHNKIRQKKIKEKRKKDSDSDSLNDSEKEEKIDLENNDKNNFKILFRTERMNDYNLITQYDPKKDETSCILSMIYNRNDINMPKTGSPDLDNKKNYIELYQKNLINSYPSIFIFLIDQSGSMSGKPINIVKESLIFFLQSLPKNSYYQLIGFGSKMKYISSEIPLEYTAENIEETIKKVKKLEANLGGTKLYKPLENIFSNENFDNLNLCKNLFILTDGEVWDREKSLKVIKNNLDDFRVHSFGIGNNFDKKFIVESGKNGSYNFIKDMDKIKSSVIQTLNKALRNYLFDFKIDVKNIDTEYHYFPKQKIYYQDEFLNYYFIIKNKLNNNININIEYYDKKELIKKEINFDNNNISENDGDIISKIIIGNILNNTDLPQEKNIELSKRYQVLSKYTSLYAEVENEKSTQNEMIIIEQKKLKEIVESESDSDNDFLRIRPKKKRKCKKNKNIESDSDNDSGKRYKKKKCMKKCKKISNDSESDEKDDKKCKKFSKKCKKISNDSESDEEEVKKCKKNINDSESDEEEDKKCNKDLNDNESYEEEKKKCKNRSKKCDVEEKKKRKKFSKKFDKNLNDGENNEEEKKKYKKSSKKCKKISDDNESDKEEVKEFKKILNDSESDEEEKKKYKKSSKKNKKISNDSESEKEDENNAHSGKETKKVFNAKEMTLTQNIIDGNWSINFQTQLLIDSYTAIYNKIKKYVEKLDVGENKENIIVTILVLYYLKNNKDIDQTEYLLIINKGLHYLQNLGIKELLYENIESNIK